MNKPLTILKQEYIQRLAELTNQSGLPLELVVYVLSDFTRNLQMSLDQQARQWENSNDEQGIQGSTEGSEGGELG